MLLPRRHGTLQKFIQSKFLDQLQRQPRPAELPAVLDPHPRDIDLDESRLGLVFQEKFALRRSERRIGRLLHA